MVSMESGIMASNNKTTAKANKTTAKANNNAAAVSAVSPDQSAISELTTLVRRLMVEITELKAEKAVNSEIKTTPDNKTTAKVPANKTPDNKTAKVNVVPPANGFVLLSENESVSEVVTISAIGSPFWGKGFGGRSVMKQAINCVTKTGNTIVVFMLLNRDAVGNTIPSGLVGGANYVMTGVASGKTSEFNGNKANIINKAKFSPAS
jgi:hypothetical protein